MFHRYALLRQNRDNSRHYAKGYAVDHGCCCNVSYECTLLVNVDITAHGGYEAPAHHPHVEPQYAAPHVDPQYAPPHHDPHQGQFHDQHQHQVCG